MLVGQAEDTVQIFRSVGGPGVYDAANHPLGAEAVQLASGPLVPSVTTLRAPMPNPFRGQATLAFSMARPGRVQMMVYGVDGRRVRTLVDDAREAGEYSLQWDGRDASGRPVGAGVFCQVRPLRTLVYLE